VTIAEPGAAGRDAAAALHDAAAVVQNEEW